MIRNSLTGQILREHKIISVVCKCGTVFESTQDRIDLGRGKYCSKSCMYIYRNAQVAEQHYKWKGSKVSYSGIHKWAAKEFGQPMRCEWCGFESGNKFQIQWANLTGKYLRAREDWARLCAKCHYHYDRGTK